MATKRFGDLWTWAANPEPVEKYRELAADVRDLWTEYAAAQRRIKHLETQAELAANSKKAARTLTTDYASRVRELEDALVRAEAKRAAANMPLRLAALFAALAGLALTLAVVL